MWRTYVICVLIGLLLVTSGSSVVLLRQVISTQAEVDRLRQQLKLAATPAATASTTAAIPAPTLALGSPNSDVLQRIESDVVTLRGLQPKASVPVRVLDQPALQQFFVDRFNQDYLPSERESDQKLLATLGIVNPGESVAQILLGVLQEQIIGMYNQDDKVM